MVGMDDAKGDSDSNRPPQIPKDVITGAKQLNRGESVSKEEMMNRLAELSEGEEYIVTPKDLKNGDFHTLEDVEDRLWD